MLHALILVCILGVPCDETSAVDVMKTPVQSQMPYTCLRDAQAFLAQMSIGELSANEYVRIACKHSH
jgi:hypothetical protein